MAINSITGNTLLTSGSFPPVRAASTGANINLQTIGLGVIDGVQLVGGDRVLVKDQTDATTNGIYAAQTGPWVRTTDATTNTQFFSGMAVTVGLGAVNAGLTFICTTTDDPVVVGTSLLTFVAQSLVATATQQATSPTSFLIGTGSKVFTIQAGKAFQVGQWVIIQETSNSANQMLGQITAYSGNSLTVSVTNTGGSGTHADWTIVLTNSPGAAGFQPPVGTGNVTGPGSSTTGHIATFADGTGKVLSDGGAAFGGANTITPSMLATAAVAFGAGMLNGVLAVTVAGNALTVALKTLALATPSPSDPVFFLFRDDNAGYAVIEQTAALSITVPSGATLGTGNGQANRIWVGVWNNGGTAVLGVYNSLNSSTLSILPWDETSLANGTGITSGSTSPQIWYTASTLSSKVLRILGYVESIQNTAGTWFSQPGKVQLFGPGVKRPGDTVQEQTAAVGTQDTISSATFVALTNNRISITPQAAANLFRIEAAGPLTAPNATGTGQTTVASVQLSQGTVNNAGLIGTLVTNSLALAGAGASQGAQLNPSYVFGYSIPNTTSSLTYAVQGRASGGAGTGAFGGGTQLAAREIQI